MKQILASKEYVVEIFEKNRTHWMDGVVIKWDGNTEDRDTLYFSSTDSYLYKVSDMMPSASELETSVMVYFTPNIGDDGTTDGTGQAREYSSSGLVYGEDDNYINCVGIRDGVMVIYNTEFSIGDTSYTAPSTGVYFTHFSGGGIGTYVQSLSYGNVTYHTLDEAFIPDTIARTADLAAPKTELILTSSTEGSTKQFKLTIDDEGVLTATEIVESEA